MVGKQTGKAPRLGVAINLTRRTEDRGLPAATVVAELLACPGWWVEYLVTLRIGGEVVISQVTVRDHPDPRCPPPFAGQITTQVLRSVPVDDRLLGWIARESGLVTDNPNGPEFVSHGRRKPLESTGERLLTLETFIRDRYDAGEPKNGYRQAAADSLRVSVHTVDNDVRKLKRQGRLPPNWH